MPIYVTHFLLHSVSRCFSFSNKILCDSGRHGLECRPSHTLLMLTRPIAYINSINERNMRAPRDRLIGIPSSIFPATHFITFLFMDMIRIVRCARPETWTSARASANGLFVSQFTIHILNELSLAYYSRANASNEFALSPADVQRIHQPRTSRTK